jgi:hypothetical protein
VSGADAGYRARRPEHDRLVHGLQRRHRAGGRVQRHHILGAGRAVGLKTIATLGTLASLATAVVVTVPDDLAPGVYALSAVADADDVIPELGGLDAPAANGRVATKTISVQPPL